MPISAKHDSGRNRYLIYCSALPIYQIKHGEQQQTLEWKKRLCELQQFLKWPVIPFLFGYLKCSEP